MPVLVTAAEQPLARQIATRLLQEGGEVRAYADGDTSALRAAGAFIASGTPDDEGRLEAAAAEVHTIVHVGGGLLTSDPSAIVRDAGVLLRAAGNAGVRRIIGLSLPGASPQANDPIRQAKGEFEGRFEQAPVPTIVLRSSLVATPRIRDVLATAGIGAAGRQVPVAPIQPADLVEAVVAFDRARSSATTGHLVVALDGPERLTVGAWLTRSGVAAPGRGGMVGRQLADIARTAHLQDALDGPWWTEDPTVLDGWGFTGITPAPPVGSPPPSGHATG